MSDVTPFIQAKSDQLNADDLIGGPVDVTIKGFKIVGGKDQPIWLDIGAEGRPWKPCKTMTRLIVAITGSTDARAWVGMRIRLYRDPTAQYGGVSVGGVRLSHSSSVSEIKTFLLTEKRGKKRSWTVHPLAPEEARTANTSAAPDVVVAAPETAPEIDPRIREEWHNIKALYVDRKADLWDDATRDKFSRAWTAELARLGITGPTDLTTQKLETLAQWIVLWSAE